MPLCALCDSVVNRFRSVAARPRCVLCGESSFGTDFQRLAISSRHSSGARKRIRTSAASGEAPTRRLLQEPAPTAVRDTFYPTQGSILKKPAPAGDRRLRFGLGRDSVFQVPAQSEILVRPSPRQIQEPDFSTGQESSQSPSWPTVEAGSRLRPRPTGGGRRVSTCSSPPRTPINQIKHSFRVTVPTVNILFRSGFPGRQTDRKFPCGKESPGLSPDCE